MTTETLQAENAMLRKNVAILEAKIGELRKQIINLDGPSSDEHQEIVNLQALVTDQRGVIDMLRNDLVAAVGFAKSHEATIKNVHAHADAKEEARRISDEENRLTITSLRADNETLRGCVKRLQERLKPNPQLQPWVTREQLLQRVKELEGDLKTALDGKRQACEALARTKAAGRAPYEREIRRLRARLAAFCPLLTAARAFKSYAIDVEQAGERIGRPEDNEYVCAVISAHDAATGKIEALDTEVRPDPDWEQFHAIRAELAKGQAKYPCGACGVELLYSARQRGDGLCGPCYRKQHTDRQNPVSRHGLPVGVVRKVHGRVLEVAGEVWKSVAPCEMEEPSTRERAFCVGLITAILEAVRGDQ